MSKLLIKEFGSVANLLAAYAALQTVPPKNFKMVDDFGQPFKASDIGKSNAVCNAAGWIAQHPHFKALGLRFEEMLVAGKKRFVPVMTIDKATAQGYNALAYALEMDAKNTLYTFAPDFYNPGFETTVEEVLIRLKKIIGKAGGAASLDAYLESQKPPKPVKETPKKAKKAVKKAKSTKK